MKAYLANGLFSESDQIYNRFLADKIRSTFKNLDLYVPQENDAINDKKGYANSLQIFDGDNCFLDESDIMITVLDGVEVDSGVSAEIGRYVTLCELDKSKKRTIYGIYSDIRQQGRENEKKIQALIEDGAENQFMYRNLYVIGAIKKYGYLVDGYNSLLELMKNNLEAQ